MTENSPSKSDWPSGTAGVGAGLKMTPAQFVARVKDVAVDIDTKYGLGFIGTITQASHESDWGNSGLTRSANNLFGFKAGTKWLKEGLPVVRLPTIEFSTSPPDQIKYWEEPGDVLLKIWQEHIKKTQLKVLAAFRRYDSWYSSLQDWAELLTKRSANRYKKAVEAARDGDEELFYRELQAAGFATDPTYSHKLIARGKEVTKLLYGPKLDLA